MMQDRARAARIMAGGPGKRVKKNTLPRNKPVVAAAVSRNDNNKNLVNKRLCIFNTFLLQ
jgi:hypothetical protein